MILQNFLIDENIKITLVIPDPSLKVNYYNQPTEKLNKFDEITINLITKKGHLELFKDILTEAILPLYVTLKNVLQNSKDENQIEAKNAGLILNYILKEYKDNFLSSSWVWTSSSNIVTLIYKNNNQIYLEIIPLYPWLYSKPNSNENYISFKDFITKYKPYLTMTIPKSTAQNWLFQCEEILKEIT